MVDVPHPTLGTLSFDDQGVADGQVKVGDLTVEFDIWFEEEIVATKIEPVAALVTRGVELHGANQAAIRTEYRSDDEDAATPLYRKFHIDEFDADELQRVFGTSDAAHVDEDAFMNALKLIRIGAYPDAEEPHMVWDYSFDTELTDHLLSVELSLDGAVQAINLES